MCSQIPYKEETNMKANRITAGQIYLLNNLFPAYSSDKPVPEKHNYIVISKEPKTDIGMVQVMEICSLRNREPIAEVPIVLENNCISYVIPYNIYSVRVKEILNQKDILCMDADKVEKICDATQVSKADKLMLERFQELPRVVKNWSDDDLCLWYNATKRYTTKILMMYCHQFRNEQALWSRTYRIKKEMEHRNIVRN